MYKVNFFADMELYKDTEEAINKFLKENDVIPITIMHANNYYVLLYIDKGE